jgi:hypothetical protein
VLRNDHQYDVIKNVSFLKTFCRFPLKGQSSGNLVPFFDIYSMDRPRPENEPLLNIKFFNFLNQKLFIFKPRPIHIFQKTELKSRWSVPLKISHTITWLAIVQ